MSTGTVKWFNMQKGYGFIAPENGGADVFVHITAVEKAGFRTLNENEKIAYDLLSEKVAEKIVVPQPEKTEIDYETLSKEVKTSAGNLRKA